MSSNPAFCPNHFTCESVADSIYPSSESNPDEEETTDDLSDRNPDLSRTCYYKTAYSSEIDERAGWFWVVPNRDNLPVGYSAAVDAQIAARCEPNELIVTQNRIIEGLGGYEQAERNRSFFFEINSSPITLIEWIPHPNGERELRKIYTEDPDGQYWCRECKSGTLLCTKDDTGPVEYDYWLRDDQNSPETYGPEAKQVPFPAGTQFETLKTWLEQAHSCEELLYCSVCNDYTYAVHYRWSVCEHLRYIDAIDSWGGVGYVEEDHQEDYQTAFQCLAQTENANAIQAALQQKDWKRILRLIIGLHNDGLEPAIAYLQTLDDSTPTAFEQCLIWLEAGLTHQTLVAPML